MYYNHTERSVCKQCVITSSNPNSVLRHVLSTERENECNWEKATKILLKVAFEDWSADFFCSLCLFVASNQQLYMNPKFPSKCCQNVAKMLPRQEKSKKGTENPILGLGHWPVRFPNNQMISLLLIFGFLCQSSEKNSSAMCKIKCSQVPGLTWMST